MAVDPLFLVGIGQDSHRLQPASDNQSLWLAGLSFACGLTFVANSDGDIILHALYNAISTALGGGSLGPVATPLCEQGITESRQYLQPLLQTMTARHYHLSNLSVALRGKQPHLEKYFPLMAQSLGKILHLDPQLIGLSVTSDEELTAFGRGEALMATAFIMLQHD